VTKHRTVWLYRNCRIHLDRVERLGDFLEFEAVLPEGAPDAEGRALVEELTARFAIRRRTSSSGRTSTCWRLPPL